MACEGRLPCSESLFSSRPTENSGLRILRARGGRQIESMRVS